MKKILIVTIKFPFPPVGACESDRASGILHLRRLSFDVKVITKITEYQSAEKVQEVSRELGIEMTPIRYKFDPKFSKIQKLKKYIIRFFTNPLMLDGTAFEYNDPELKDILVEQMKNWQPDLVWFDHTCIWPVYHIVKKYKVPIITRSHNFEPVHFLDENGRSFLNYLRFLPKLVSEIMVVKKSNLIFAITPKEAEIYKKLGARELEVLPLMGLPKCLRAEREIKEKDKLNVFFMGSSYNIFHMRRALEFILKEIAPRINKLAPDKFCFHFFGRKFPEKYNKYLGENVIYRGYVDDFEAALEEMDIALVPSFFGAGMQQKIFEPLSRGFPTVTSPRGIAGYPFENGKHLLLASDPGEFIEHLIKLQDLNLRKSLSEQSLKVCHQIFSQEALDSIILTIKKFLR